MGLNKYQIMVSADSLVYKIAIVEELPIAESVSVWEIISIFISAIAVFLSIWAIKESRNRDNTRKLKDFFISELEEVNNRLEDLVGALGDSHVDITCQDVITSFKRIMMKLEVVLEMVESSLILTDGWDSSNIKLAYNDIRTYVTEAESFVASFNTDNVTLNKSEMNDTYNRVMIFYRKNVENIRIINGVDSLKGSK